MKIQKTISVTLSFLLSGVFFFSCSDDFEEPVKNSVNIDLSGELTMGGPNSLITDENDPSNKYSRVDSIAQYGYGAGYTIPDSLKDCDLKLVISGKMRETENITGYIAIALHGKDSIYFWGNVFGYVHVKQLNTWTNFIDSLIIPKSSNKPSSQNIKIFPFKQTGKGYYDVDNLLVKITRQ